MSDQTAQDVRILNELLEVTRDSVAGYREAAADATDGEIRSIFTQRAEDRQHIVELFEEKVRGLGGTPVESGSLLAAAHRVFLNFREKISTGDEALLAEVERGEDFIKSKYEAALKDGQLSPLVRDSVRTAFGSVWSGHEEARALKLGDRIRRPQAM